jgi:hypothetical protein
VIIGLALIALAVMTGESVHAQASGGSETQPDARRTEHRAGDIVKFLAGAALGLAAHEGAHLAFDFAFDAHPHLTRVQFGGIPFFAIEHRPDLSPRREFTVSAAGFWMQQALNEMLLVRRPSLRSVHAPGVKGLAAFNILASIGYGAVAMAKAGPVQRDTRGMADSAGLDERAIAAVVLAPAILDGYRLYKPDAAWAKWAARAAKAGSVLLIVKDHE